MAGSWRRGCKQAGVQADLAPPLCTPDGLARLRKLTAAKARPWLVAACGPEIHAGFFQALAARGAAAGGGCAVLRLIWRPRWAP